MNEKRLVEEKTFDRMQNHQRQETCHTKLPLEKVHGQYNMRPNKRLSRIARGDKPHFNSLSKCYTSFPMRFVFQCK